MRNANESQVSRILMQKFGAFRLPLDRVEWAESLRFEKSRCCSVPDALSASEVLDDGPATLSARLQWTASMLLEETESDAQISSFVRPAEVPALSDW